ncbi:MAG: YgiT-type zinc finger protein [Elusimicrobia bacterium]|nr:YgiT-type zinc finger protein [Elusimicrobiota bacterium]
MKNDPCEYCGGSVKQRKARVDHRWKGALVVVEKVPVGVCRRCGERYYDASVLRRLDLMAQGKVGSVGRISVPVGDYSRAVAA